MKKILLTFVAVVAALGLSFGVTAASADEQAKGQGAQIVRVDNNVKGTDTAANAYQESVKVQNRNTGVGDGDCDANEEPLDGDVLLTGYTLQDATGHTFRFKSGTCLKPGDYVYVRTGRSPVQGNSWWNGPVNQYWNKTSHQYGNTTDSVTLENAAGERLDRVAWNDFAILP